MSTPSSLNKPPTPLHPEPNQEFQLNHSTIPDHLKDALALDDSDLEEEESNAYLQQQEQTKLEELEDDEDVDEPMSDVSEVELDGTPYSNMQSLSPTSTRIKSPGSTINDNDATTVPVLANGNFFDFNSQRRQPLNPFGANNNLTSSNPIRITRRKSTATELQPPLHKLSMSQQTRLINYIDDRLMNVQRKFIKYLSLRSESGHIEISPNLTIAETYYDLSQTITHLDEIITMLWYSIFKLKDVPLIGHSNLFISSDSDIEKNQLKQEELIGKIENFEINPDFLITVGQTNYLIRIMGDLIDYLEKYPLDTYNDLLIVLKLLAKLDNIISVFIDTDAPVQELPAPRTYDSHSFDDDDDDDDDDDTTIHNKDFAKIEEETEESTHTNNDDNNSNKMINNTEKIRIESIVNRTRILLIQKFDYFKNLEKSKRRKNNGDAAHHGGVGEVGLYELFIGEVYEGISDRVSI